MMIYDNPFPDLFLWDGEPLVSLCLLIGAYFHYWFIPLFLIALWGAFLWPKGKGHG